MFAPGTTEYNLVPGEGVANGEGGGAPWRAIYAGGVLMISVATALPAGSSSAIGLGFDLPTRFLDKPGQRAGFVVLAAFLVSFLFIRTSARLMRSPRVPWWPGSVSTSSGLHLHHLVWGIVLLPPSSRASRCSA